MSRANGPVDDVRNDPSVNVVYADPGKDSYVSVSGNAQVVEDAARKQRLWSKMNDAWFPRGPTDPDVALVEVKIVQAHYWDVDDSKIVQLFKIAAAAVTGKPPRNLGEIDLAIGIGRSLTTPLLPHHRAYGSRATAVQLIKLVSEQTW